jgi:hypothetical protein
MFYNFLKPKTTFENSLNNEDYSGAVTIAVITAAIFGIASFFYSNSIISAVFVLISFVLQWYILTAILYFFEFAMKNRRKRINERTFKEVATASGKLWILPLLMSVATMAIIVLNNDVILLLGVLALAVLGLIYLFNLYVLVKVTLQAQTRKRAIVAFILLLVLHNLIMATTLGIIGLIL